MDRIVNAFPSDKQAHVRTMLSTSLRGVISQQLIPRADKRGRVTDIWVRFQRMRGHDCLYVCASDAHGTPIMLKARQEGVSPEELIARVSAEQRRDFADFDVSFDNFHTTHSDENREVTNEIYRRLLAAGHIRRETIRQAYDAQAKMFLPDRYVRGTCPKCGALDQYGDAASPVAPPTPRPTSRTQCRS